MAKAVVGITGLIGSGKGELAKIAEREPDVLVVNLSDYIREELAKRKQEETRTSLQNAGNEMRKKMGAGILAEMAARDFEASGKRAMMATGIRNPEEVRAFRKKYGKKFVLIAVAAKEEQLKKRKAVEKGEFERDAGEGEPDYGLQTKKCIAMAGITLQNDGSLDEFRSKALKMVLKELG